MESIQGKFFIEILQDHMSAMLHCTSDYDGSPVDETALKKFLLVEGIRAGIIKEAVENTASGMEGDQFPILIAKGSNPKHGQDGEIKCFFETSNERIQNSEEYDFREVMKIPSVKKDEKLAIIIPPEPGVNGENIFGEQIFAQPGKPCFIKAGKNVSFNKEDHAFYAKDTGQASIHNNEIHVYSVYTIHESVSMKTGNIQFAGSIVIHGDVPSGFKVKANGDVKIFGMVEAATITANGSVFIEEGFSGMKKGMVMAGKDVHMGYINQGTVLAGHDIIVVNSILHSYCTASGKITSKNGNIIGGSTSAGTFIESQEIGNKHNTLTNIHFGLDKEHEQRLEELCIKKSSVAEERQKIDSLGKQIEERDYQNNLRLRIALLRQRNKLSQLDDAIADIEIQIEQLENLLGREHDSKLTAREAIFSNSVISFGKYMQKVDKDYGPIQVVLEQNEIFFRPLV